MRQSRQKFIKKIIPVILAIFIASASVTAEAEVPDITYVSRTSSPYSSAKLEYTKAGTYTWTVPAGIDMIKVTTVGGGGRGDDTNINGTLFYGFSSGIYSGAGGAIVENIQVKVSPSQQVTIVVAGSDEQSYVQVNGTRYAVAVPGEAALKGSGEPLYLVPGAELPIGYQPLGGQPGGGNGCLSELKQEPGKYGKAGSNYGPVYATSWGGGEARGGGGSWGNGGSPNVSPTVGGGGSYLYGNNGNGSMPQPQLIGYQPGADGAVFINYGSASVPVEGIKFDAVSSTVGMGSTTTLNYTITPAEATNQTVTWQSSDPAVATIDAATGVVTPVATGRTEITATTEDGGFSDTTLLIVTNTLETIKLKLITESGKYPTFGTVYYKAPGNVIEYPGTAVNASGEMNVSVPSTAEEISLGVSLLNTLISGTVLTPGTKDASATPFYMIEGDFNADNLINGTDWTILVQRMNFGGGETQYGLTGDMNYDGVVDDFDRLLFNSPITHNGEQRFLASGYDMNSINAADASQAREISLDTEKNNDVPAAAPANSIIKINQTEDGRYAVGLSEPSEPVNMLQLSLEGDILNSTYSVPEGFELIGTYEEKGKTVMAIGTAKEGGDVIPSGKPIVTVMAADTPELKYGENDTTMQLATPDGIETVSFESSDSTGKTGTHASGGSSGCNTGTAAIALLAFAPLIIHKSRNRRNDKQ